MKLHELADNDGARKPRKRIGRGVGSGTGKTGGRGVKGQKSRSGVAIKGFEGGQMPLHMRMPKRGFNKPNRLRFVEVNIGTLQAACEAGKLDADQKITVQTLVSAGLARRALDGVRVLGQGSISVKLNLEVAYATESARAAIEGAGGSVTMNRKTPKPSHTRKNKIINRG